jgi:hypothetical protein
MKRATKFFLLTVLLAVSWVSIVFNYVPIKLDPKIYDIVKVVSEILAQILPQDNIANDYVSRNNMN